MRYQITNVQIVLPDRVIPEGVCCFTDRGEIAVGKRADLVICDHKMNVSTVILQGEVVD